MTAPSPARLAGDAALLIDAPGVAAELAQAVAGLGLDGVLDVVPGAATVLVVTEPGSRDLSELGDLVVGLLTGLLASRPAAAGTAPDQVAAETGGEAGAGIGVEIPVSYDGPDLAEVAELTGLTVADVIARHQAAEYRVGWLGFAPGFGYLTGLDPVLARVPRLATPRVSVPAGSVAIAGGLGAVYPGTSPGGWRLLGRTSAVLWDPAREPPALLAPGMRVRFRPATEAERLEAERLEAGRLEGGRREAGRLEAGLPGRGGEPDSASDWTGPVEIVRPGPLATIQDLGRPRYGHLGVPLSGAADAASLRLANRLVGNDDGAAGLEFTLGRAVLRFHSDAVVAVTGATTPVSIELTGAAGGGAAGAGAAGGEAGQDRALALPAGAVLRLGAPVAGLRTYLAIGGGISVPAVLGSRSADLLSGLGPLPLRAGDRLPVGSARPLAVATPVVTTPVVSTPAAAAPAGATASAAAGIVSLRVLAGPRDDWLEAEALRVLTTAAYQVTPASNRTGVRLAGPTLARARAGELPSEGMVAGALQVPHDGQPILLLADHPATGGYPVIAVVHSADVGRAAQLRPGQKVRFTLAGTA